MNNAKLPNVKILSGGALQNSKIFIDGVDYTKKLPIKSVGFEVGFPDEMVPVVKLEIYADTVEIDAKAKVDRKCVKE